jgi:uncharacterized membrane protein (DUF106 family)
MKKSKYTIENLRSDLYSIKEEIRNDISGPVVASFGFIIALVWRDAIKGALDEYLLRAGLLENAYIYQIISAIIVTIIFITIIIIFTKWGRKRKRKKFEKEFKEEVGKEIKEKMGKEIKAGLEKEIKKEIKKK